MQYNNKKWLENVYIFLNFNAYFKFYAIFIVILHKYWKINPDIKKVYCNFIQILQEKGYSKKEFIEKAIQAYIDNNWRIIKYKAVLKAFNGIVV